MCCKFETCNDEDLIKTVDVQIARVTVGEGDPDAVDVYFRATNPSKKLHLTLETYARPGQNGGGLAGVAHNYTGETWQLYAVAGDNPEIQLNAAFVNAATPPNPVPTPRSLPDSRNIWDGVKIVRGVVHIVNNQNQTGDIYKVRAIWEPVDSMMTLAERKYWFAKCQLSPELSTEAGVSNIGGG